MSVLERFWARRKASRVCVPKSFHSNCRESLLYQFTLGVIEMCLASPMNFTRKPPRLTLNEFNGENSFQEHEKFKNSPNTLCAALECINFSPSRPTRNKHFRLLIFRTEIKRSEWISRFFFLVRRLRRSLDKFTRNLLKWVSQRRGSKSGSDPSFFLWQFTTILSQTECDLS